MKTNKTVCQVFTANKSIKSELRVTCDSTSVHIHGTAESLHTLAEIIIATIGGGGNLFAQGFRAQLEKSEPSGFMLTPDSVEKISFHCDENFESGNQTSA